MNKCDEVLKQPKNNPKTTQKQPKSTKYNIIKVK